METKLSTKQRLLKIQDLLKKYTDEHHQLTIKELVDLFYTKTEQTVGHKAVRDDLRELAESGLFDVIENHEKNGVEKYYSHQTRLFEIHELRLLIDAVSSAKFITKAETENLVKKLKKLTSIELAKQLENRILLPEGTKSGNKEVRKTINVLHEAIWKKQVIQFQYGKYNNSKDFQLSRNGDGYSVKPYALVWNNEFYYLIGEFQPEGDIRHYRIDRMRNVEITNRTFLIDPHFDISRYTQTLFHMYSGEERSIEIEFVNQLLNVVIDRFGLDVNIRPHTEETFRITTNAVISDGLVRWLLTWGSDAKVISPPSLVTRMKAEAGKLFRHYE
ncbi:helix-turn-helix transcriptional regulator [Alkalihalobacterium alkalinitrilicum]|uniref:helix-turn-helix transcriptional regulator n=1 Tax=Alkalihalobacterium alkalinitrilicum TaxID=427920 RepID=UPI003B75B678